MSYANAPALQSAIYNALSGDATLDGLVSGAIFDMAPGGVVPARFVALGPEKVAVQTDASGCGAVHDFEVMVVSESDGFLALKEIAARVSEVLDGAALPMGTGALVSLAFTRAQALRRTTDDTRRVRMFFRARTDSEI